MVPMLRQLLSPEYEGLSDHPSVHRFQPVPGMGSRVSHIFTHVWEESMDATMSRFNLEEAEMVAAFVDYLYKNGTPLSSVTVLTFYNGQRKRILRATRAHESLKNESLRVVTVDSYQGEENDVIILSLVRSNQNGNIGFLKGKNRTVVALSRAKRGLYIFGNFGRLLEQRGFESFDLWKSTLDTLNRRGDVVVDKETMNGLLPIVCRNHGTELFTKSAEDFPLSAGCKEPCWKKLTREHLCNLTCHP